MPLKYAPYLILALGLAIVGFGLWYQRQNPPRVTSTGTVRVEDRKSGQQFTLDTRVVTTGAFTREEVRLPNGTWIDCRGDCRETVRREHFEFFDEQRLNR